MTYCNVQAEESGETNAETQVRNRRGDVQGLNKQTDNKETQKLNPHGRQQDHWAQVKPIRCSHNGRDTRGSEETNNETQEKQEVKVKIKQEDMRQHQGSPESDWTKTEKHKEGDGIIEHNANTKTKSNTQVHAFQSLSKHPITTPFKLYTLNAIIKLYSYH